MAVPTSKNAPSAYGYSVSNARAPAQGSSTSAPGGAVSTVLTTVHSTVDAAIRQITPIAVVAKDYTFAAAGVAKSILDRYPPLKVFVYTLTATSAIPLAVFFGYLAITLAICLSIAGTGVALVQGGFALFAGFVLFWFLAGAFVLTCIVTFWLTAGYLAFQAAKAVERAAS
ncbi:hypothetical protein DFJ73DRAFT_800078 [Zopfochytrium polystomum]|nr:hypothetical protein DFJ73DRAFT_800078 [Zopfochytrium polystomum]